MGLLKEMADSPAIGGSTNVQLLLQMTNSTSPVVLSIEPTGSCEWQQTSMRPATPSKKL